MFRCPFFVVENTGTQTGHPSTASHRLVFSQPSHSWRNTTSGWWWKTRWERKQRATASTFLTEVRGHKRKAQRLKQHAQMNFICPYIRYVSNNAVCLSYVWISCMCCHQCVPLWSGTEWASGWRTPLCPGSYRGSWPVRTSSVSSQQIRAAPPRWLAQLKYSDCGITAAGHFSVVC